MQSQNDGSSRILVTSYVNPDTDGVAGAIALAELLRAEGREAIVFFAGRLNAETSWLRERAASRTFVGPQPNADFESVALVDTHHPHILPEFVEPEAVEFVIDHHPDGSPDSFPGAEIQNESVGAACTLVAERCRESGRALSNQSRLLLAGGIVSNTLGFDAPSTSPRDRVSFEWLLEDLVSSDEFLAECTSARSELLRKEALDVLTTDIKFISAEDGSLLSVVGQIEMSDARQLVDDGTAAASLRVLQKGHEGLLAVVNLVDLTARRSFLLSSSDSLTEDLARLLGASSEGGLIEVDRIAIRKTDVLPALRRSLGVED